METVNTGWLKNNDGEKFAPRTLTSQIVTDNGKTLDVMVADVKSDINSLSESVVYMDEYDDSVDVNTSVSNTGNAGTTGSSGIYIGSGDMPDGYNVQIDPEGSASEVVTKGEFNELNSTLDIQSGSMSLLGTPEGCNVTSLSGNWYKIGKIVFFSTDIGMSNSGDGDVGIAIPCLPFTVKRHTCFSTTSRSVVFKNNGTQKSILAGAFGGYGHIYLNYEDLGRTWRVPQKDLVENGGIVVSGWYEIAD